MFRICGSLASYGWRVTLAGRQKSGSPPLSENPFKCIRLRCIFEKGPLFYLEYNLRLFVWLWRNTTNGDVIYAVDADTLVACTLAARLKGNKMVYDAHEYFTETPELAGRPFVRSVWGLVQKMFVPYASLCFTVSDSLADILGQMYHKTFYTIRNVPFLQQEKLTKPVSINEPYLLYQGMVNEGRGLEAMIQAMPVIEGLSLIIAGDGDIMDRVRRLASESPAKDKIIFTGWQTHAQLRALTRGAAIGINLLEPASKSYYYSLANKYFDYMHAGMPCLCMDFPEYRKINDKYQTGILIPDLQPTLIAEAVNSLIKNPQLLQILSDNCLKASHEFCWQREEEKLVRLSDYLMI